VATRPPLLRRLRTRPRIPRCQDRAPAAQPAGRRGFVLVVHLLAPYGRFSRSAAWGAEPD
jgi:hypothetical protein